MRKTKDLEKLLEHLGLSRQGYHKVRKGVAKRLARFMSTRGLVSMEALLRGLERDPVLKDACLLELTVSISRFYRDKWLWQVLKYEVLPLLAQKNMAKAWCAGAASGEEPYTLAMVWLNMMIRSREPAVLDILATDLNPAYLKRARKGEYEKSSLKDLPSEYLEKFFRVSGCSKIFHLKEMPRKQVVFKLHDLLKDPPPGIFDLVLLRNNMLTYPRKNRHRAILQRVLRGLEPGGWLAIGQKETLPDDCRCLKAHPSCRRLFCYEP